MELEFLFVRNGWALYVHYLIYFPSSSIYVADSAQYLLWLVVEESLTLPVNVQEVSLNPVSAQYPANGIATSGVGCHSLLTKELLWIVKNHQVLSS